MQESQEVSLFSAGDHNASRNRQDSINNVAAAFCFKTHACIILVGTQENTFMPVNEPRVWYMLEEVLCLEKLKTMRNWLNPCSQ